MKLLSAVSFILLISGNVLLAQQEKKFSGTEDDAQIIHLNKGDVFRNNSSGVIILSKKAARMLEGRIEKDSITIALQTKQIEVLNETIQNYVSLTARMDSVHRIQDIAFNTLRDKQKEMSDLVKTSNDNTIEALSLAKKQRFISYVSGTLAGFVAGGLIAGKSGDRFNAPWALGGALIGFAVNLLIQRF